MLKSRTNPFFSVTSLIKASRHVQINECEDMPGYNLHDSQACGHQRLYALNMINTS